MKKIIVLFLVFSAFFNVSYSQAKAVYLEIGGPGLASANFDMRFAKTENGAGFRIGVGAFSVNSVSVVTVPVGLNYLIGKEKNFFELGAGFTYLNVSAKNNGNSKDFKSSYGNATIGYRYAPPKHGFFFKAEITPVFGDGFFIPYFGGLGFGYKF